MATATNISLADAQDVPETHTFIPLGPQGKYDMVFEDQTQESPIGFWRIGVRHKRPSGSSRTASGDHYVTVTLMEPVLETIAVASTGLTQPPTVAFVPQVETVYRLSERSSLLVRKNLRKMNSGLQDEAQIVNWVENLVPAY